jgi:hypothetical protein
MNQYSNVGRTLFLVTAAICLAANVSPRMLMIYRCFGLCFTNFHNLNSNGNELYFNLIHIL